MEQAQLVRSPLRPAHPRHLLLPCVFPTLQQLFPWGCSRRPVAPKAPPRGLRAGLARPLALQARPRHSNVRNVRGISKRGPEGDSDAAIGDDIVAEL